MKAGFLKPIPSETAKCSIKHVKRRASGVNHFADYSSSNPKSIYVFRAAPSIRTEDFQRLGVTSSNRDHSFLLCC